MTRPVPTRLRLAPTSSVTRPRPRAPWSFLLAGASAVAVPVLVSALTVRGGHPLRASVTLLGVLATGLVVCALLLPSRWRRVSRRVGIDRILRWHRVLGVLVVAVVAVHVAVAVVADPRGIALLDPVHTSTAAHPGMVAAVALSLIGFTRRLARRRGARYRRWHTLHLVLAAIALVEVALHVVLLRHLITRLPDQAWMVALAGLVLAVLVHRWLVRPLSGRGHYLVYGRRRESESVVSLVLVPAHSDRRLRHQPGQFVWLRLRRRALGVAEHPFTIASSAAASNRLELTIRTGGEFTRGLAELPRGTPVWLDGPYGHYTESCRAAEETVTIAGGVGVSPAMSMLRTLAAEGDTRPHHLVLAGRNGEALFGTELAALARRLDLTVHQLAGRRLNPPLLATLLPAPRGGVAYYVAGGPNVVDAGLDALTASGVDPEAITTERFDPGRRPEPDRSPLAVPTERRLLERARRAPR